MCLPDSNAELPMAVEGAISTFVIIGRHLILLSVVVNNNNCYFPIGYQGCLSTRRRHSQIHKEDHGPSIFTCQHVQSILGSNIQSLSPSVGQLLFFWHGSVFATIRSGVYGIHVISFFLNFILLLKQSRKYLKNQVGLNAENTK